MKMSLLSTFSVWFVNVLLIQFFILSLSFPILVCWGIPFSPLIFLGNILFTPVLTLFLGLAGIIYLLELLSIPSDYACVMLDALTTCWFKALACTPDVPLIACPLAPWWLLLMMPLGGWAILRTYGFKERFKSLLFLLCWVALIFFSIKWWFTPEHKEHTVMCGSKGVLLTCFDGKVTLLDKDGALHTRACSRSWIDYTLSSELIKNFGTLIIDEIIVAKNTPATVKNVEIIHKKYHNKRACDLRGSSLFDTL